MLCSIKSLVKQHDECQERVKDIELQMQTTERRLARAGKVLSGVSIEGVRWSTDARTVKEDMTNLLSDTLLAAGALAFTCSISLFANFT